MNAKENMERASKNRERHMFVAAALVVASQGFSDPKVVAMVIVVAIAGLIILMPVSRALASPKT